MRKIYYLLLLIFSFSVLSAQEKLSKEEKARREKNIQAGNPFAKYGSKAPVATLSKGKYLEVHDLDSIVTIGTSRWHVDNKKIVCDIIIDSLNVDAQPIGDRVGRWMSPDPLSEEFPSWSPYNMSFNNPVRYVDPDGRAPTDIIGTFNKQTGKLSIIDRDHYKKGLPTLTVNASQYKLGGVRDKKGNLTHNQVLVIDNVFSGGRTDSEGNVSRDLTRDSGELAIPSGSYDLTEYEGRSDWYKVDPIDSSRYDDENQGQTNADGDTRSGYRLHLGNLSHGCITIADPNGDRKDEFGVLQNILQNTSKTEVPKREGMQKYNPSSTRLKYGEIKVVGKDRVQELKKVEKR